MATLSLRNVSNRVYEGGAYTKIYLNNCTNVTVKGATVSLTPSGINDQAIRIYNSPGTVLEDLTVLSGGGKALSGEGVNLSNSSRSRISKCVFTGFHQGITFGGCDDLTIIGNTITNTRTSPISGAPGDRLTIKDNYIGDSHPLNWGLKGGDHADEIHLFTTKPVTGLVIEGNTIDQTNGVGILGVFLQPKSGGFTNVLITNNKFIMRQGQALILKYVGGVVSFNTLVSLGTGKATARYDVYGGNTPLLLEGNVGFISLDRRLTPEQRALITIK